MDQTDSAVLIQQSPSHCAATEAATIGLVVPAVGVCHIACLRALAQQLPGLQVIEVADSQGKYPWRPDKDDLGFPRRTIFPGEIVEAIPWRRQSAAVTAALEEIRPTVIVVGSYSEPAMIAAARWAWKRRIPTVLRSVSTYHDKARRGWTEILKSRLVRRYTTVAVTGERAEEYALRLGVRRECVFRSGNMVDNERYTTCADHVRRNESRERQRLGLPTRYFLTVSRLAPEKNLLVLLKAFSQYRQCGGRWDIVLVGSGPQERQLRETVRANGIPGVHFVAWKQYDALPPYYALASCLVLASVSEPWGLVVNEAMACGLPVLVSERCGCVPELCREGENGYRFAPDSTDGLAELMVRMSSDGEQLSAFGEASRRIIASFTPQIWAEKFKTSILAAMKRRVESATL